MGWQLVAILHLQSFSGLAATARSSSAPDLPRAILRIINSPFESKCYILILRQGLLDLAAQ